MLGSCGASSTVPLNPLPPGDDGNPNSEWVDYSAPISEIRIANEDKDIVLDSKTDSAIIDFAVSPRNAIKSVVEWTSSNENIATVAKDLETGLVTVYAVNGGECDITAKSGSISDTCHVTVNVPLIDFDLNVTDINLDYYESFDLIPYFEPEDTTFTNLTWTPSDDSLTVVGGRVTAGNKTLENASIRVTSDQLDKVIVVNVNVSDKWNYVESLDIIGEASRLEVDRTMSLETVITARDPSKPASTLSTHQVQYKSLTPEILEVNEETGEVLALEAGEGQVQALLFDDRSQLPVYSNTLNIQVYEIRATSIIIKDYSRQTIELDNKYVPTITLEPQYELDELLATRPSRGHVSFSSNKPEIASVTEDGVVTALSKGEATITMVDSYSNIMDYVTVNVTIHAMSLVLAAPTNAGVGETITLSATITPKDVSDAHIEYTAIPSEGVTITPNLGGTTATAVSSEAGLVQFVATCDGVTSNVAPVTFKHEFKEGVIYVVGSKDYSSGTSSEGESWEDAGKAYALKATEEPTPEGYISQVQGRITFEEGDQLKLRNGNSWLNTIEWLDPGDGGEWTRIDHVENAGAVAAGKFSVIEDSQGYGNIKVNVAGTYDIYYKLKLGGYDIYIGDAPVFRFEYAPKTVEVGKSVTAKVSDGVGTVSVSKNNDNIEMAFDDQTGEIFIKGIVEDGKTLITAQDSEKSISYEITVIHQIAEYTLAGSFNGWNGADQNYGLEKVSDEHYVIEGIEFAVGDELQAVSSASGQWFGNASTYDGCHYTLVNDGYGKNKLVVDYAGTYDVHIWIQDGNSNPIVLALEGDSPEPPAPVVEYYLMGSFNDWTAKEQYKFAATEDSNKFVLEEVSLQKGFIMKANELSSGAWYGVAKTYENCHFTIGENGNAIVSDTDTYDVYLYISSTDDNHLQLISHGEPEPPTPTVEYYLLGSFNEWTAAAEYKFSATEDSNKFVLEGISLKAEDVMKANQNGSDNWYGVAKPYQDCHFTVGSNNDCVVSEDGEYDIYLYISSSNGNHLQLVKKGDSPEPPAPTDAYFLKGTFNEWGESDAYKFIVDAEDSNKYLLANVSLTEGDEMLVNNPAQESGWYKNDHTYDNCHYTIAEGGNIVVSETDTYDIYFYVSSLDGNHVQLVSKTEPQPPEPPVTNIQTFYITNTRNWSELKVYVWNSVTDEKMSDWPGNDLVYVYTNDQGQAVYSIDIDLEKYDTIIFNSQSDMSQTQNISLSWFAENNANAVWVKEDKDDKGNFYIEFWNYVPA